MTTDYRRRLAQAKAAWLRANPENRRQVAETWQAYQIALINYNNVKGV